MSELNPEYAIRIECPYCKAKSGQPCVDSLGNQRDFVHGLRKVIYTKQVMAVVEKGVRQIEEKIAKLEKSELYGSW